MSNQGRSYEEFDDFAKNIIDELRKFDLSQEAAVSIFLRYWPVYEVLANDYLEDESFYAEQFFDAHQEGFTPEEWLEKIRKIDSMFSSHHRLIGEVQVPPKGSALIRKEFISSKNFSYRADS